MYTKRAGLKFNVCSAALAAGALALAADGDGMEQNLGKSSKSLQVKMTARSHSKVLATQLMSIKLAQLEAPQS